MFRSLVLLLAFPSAVLAGPITAPLEGNITLTELRHIVEAGPLVWTTDGDMVIAQYWDEEPGVGATVKHPVSLLVLSETATSTTARLESVAGMSCGRFQFDFEGYPLDRSTLKSLVVDTETICGEQPHELTPTPIPEPTTLALVVVGLMLALSIRPMVLGGKLP